ncbi:hypothetical protein ACWU37_11210 [Photobacterium damselae subsp. damselae]|uniref:glycosyltransferase family 1 protein n=1 Tax=Photobacterium damselae TaxID=38293 RepID=UPI0011D097FC|nr:glycosyltransferase family 1 protein [Photobacterium damselae]KAB1506384.1 glycosyltransferase family 1 protein [Photobacterium damselae subsp. damselae]
MKNKTALIISGVAWNETWQRHQTNAMLLVNMGFQVDYINGVKTSKPTLNKIFNKLKGVFKKREILSTKNRSDERINIIPSYFIPPLGFFSKIINKIIYKMYYKDKLLNSYDVVIYYVPVDVYSDFNQICFYKIYDCVRAFKSWGGYSQALYENEEKICKTVDKIICDSFFIKDRYLSNFDVEQLIPYNEYNNKNILNHKSSIISRICYFGSVSDHIDVNLLNLLSEHYQVHIWGKIDPSISLSNKIKYHGYISDQDKLFSEINENSDAILIPYIGNMDGVFPAKLISSFSLNIPVFTSKFYDSIKMNNILYVYEDYDSLISMLENFNYEEYQKNNTDRILLLEQSSEYFDKFKNIILR